MPSLQSYIVQEKYSLMRDFQSRICFWVRNTFGVNVLYSKQERAMRLLEEALEFAQAAGVDIHSVKYLTNYVYSRPVGELHQELGGCAVTLFAAAEACGFDLIDELEREVSRLESKDADHFRQRHKKKEEAGVCVEQVA